MAQNGAREQEIVFCASLCWLLLFATLPLPLADAAANATAVNGPQAHSAPLASAGGAPAGSSPSFVGVLLLRARTL
jgi:hypothetical protein